MALARAVTRDRLTALKALRNRLAADLDSCESARDVAALSQRLMDVLGQIDEIEQPQQRKETSLSEFERRLRDRQQGTKTARRAKSG